MSPTANPFEHITRLGPLRSVHGYSPTLRNWRFILSGIVVLTLLAGSGAMLLALWPELQSPTRPLDWGALLLCPGVGWGVGGFLVLVLLGQWWLQRNFVVGLFASGLAVRTNAGTELVLPWADIHSCAPTFFRRGGRQYRLRLRAGPTLVLHRNLDNLAALGDMVSRHVPPAP